MTVLRVALVELKRLTSGVLPVLVLLLCLASRCCTVPVPVR